MISNNSTATDKAMNQRVFISYGHDEYSKFALKLADSLKCHGYDVFIDTEGIHHGEQWEIIIEDGLKWTRDGNEKGIFLLMMTPYSVRRPDGYCLNEIAYALDIELRIVPVMLKQVTPPLSIYRLQYLDLPVDVSAPEREINNYIEKIIEVLEQPERLDITGNFKKLEKSLKPIEFNSELQLFSREFVGRNWLFNSIQKWLNNGSQVLLITGMPGVGKTAISTILYQRMSNVLGFYMFRKNDNEKLSAKRFITTLAFQIASQIPEFRQSILSMELENVEQQYNDFSLFNHLIIEPLSSISPLKEDKVIIIDGLDEAEQDGVNQMAKLISNYISYFPDWLKVIILSRPIATSLLPFSGADCIEIDAMSNDNLTDLATYIKATLGDVSEERLSSIVSHSEGSFLYVKHVCQNPSNDDDKLLPAGMTSFYFNAFSDIFSPDKYIEFRKILELVLSSTRPLSKKTLKLITNSTVYEINDFITKMGAFMRVGPDGTVKLYHTSLSDWLIDEDKAGRFWVDTEAATDKLIDFLSIQVEKCLGTATSLEEYKRYKEEIEKELGLDLEMVIYPLYMDLLEKRKSWDHFIRFACMYLTGYSFFSTTKEQISNIIDRNYKYMKGMSAFEELTDLFYQRFSRRVSYLFDSIKNEGVFALTRCMAVLAYDCRDFIHVEYSPEWLTVLCSILHKAFPAPRINILSSGYSQEGDGIGGTFADEIRELLYDIKESGKVKDQELLSWMESVALPH